MNELIIWEYWGAFLGGEEIITDSVAKQTEPRIMANARIRGLVMTVPITRAIMMGTIEMAIPVSMDATISPKRIVQTANGAETSLSNVLA
jgi:hypothetical protein